MKRRLDSTLRGYVEEGIADGSIRRCNPKLVSICPLPGRSTGSAPGMIPTAI